MAWWLFQNVVITAGLALVVAAVCRTTRIGPVGRHALWLIVLVKFVTPPLVVWPWAAPDPLRVAAVAMAADAGGTSGVGWGVHAATSIATAAATPPVAQGFGVVPPDPSAGGLQAVWAWLLAVWAAGSLALLLIEGARLLRLARRARAGRPADPALAGRVAALSALLEMRPIAVRIVPGSAPPAVWSLGRPELLWPSALVEGASEVSVDGVLVHELAHVKRRDHLVAWVELVAGILWWWNPLYWYVRSALREQAELACDGWVISALPNGRRAYAESLLTLSGALGRNPVSLAVVGIRPASRRVLERRLAMIMQGRTSLRLTRAGLFALGLVAAATLPGWAAAAQDPPPPPPPPVPVVRAIPAPPPAPVLAVPAPRQTPPAPPVPAATAPPPPPKPVQVPVAPKAVPPVPSKLLLWTHQVRLPEDGQQLVDGFESDREAIEREIEQKIATRREALVKALEALQDQYTKAGKLDEAVAIRDYLRAGLPGLDGRHVWSARGGLIVREP